MKVDLSKEDDLHLFRHNLSQIKLNYFLLTPSQQNHLRLIEKLIKNLSWPTITDQQIEALEVLLAWLANDEPYDDQSHIFDELFLI
jgi:hypothetical protein